MQNDRTDYADFLLLDLAKNMYFEKKMGELFQNIFFSYTAFQVEHSPYFRENMENLGKGMTSPFKCAYGAKILLLSTPRL